MGWTIRRESCGKPVGVTQRRSGPVGVDLRLGSVENLPALGTPFDKILAVNTVLFWNLPEKNLRELRHLLRPGGRIAIAHQPRGPTATDAAAAAKGSEFAAILTSAGFSDVRTEMLRLRPAVICTIGINRAEGQILKSCIQC